MAREEEEVANDLADGAEVVVAGGSADDIADNGGGKGAVTAEEAEEGSGKGASSDGNDADDGTREGMARDEEAPADARTSDGREKVSVDDDH